MRGALQAENWESWFNIDRLKLNNGGAQQGAVKNFKKPFAVLI